MLKHDLSVNAFNSINKSDLLFVRFYDKIVESFFVIYSYKN